MITTMRRLGQQVGVVKGVTDQGFGEVMMAPKAVVMFYSPNCPYSRKFMPIYTSTANGYSDTLFVTVNVDENVQNAAKYKVQMLPTVVFFRNGQEVGRIDGVQDQGDFTSEMTRAFSGATAAVQPATASPRAGTLVDTETKSVVPYVLGGAAAMGILATAAYFIFGSK